MHPSENARPQLGLGVSIGMTAECGSSLQLTLNVRLKICSWSSLEIQILG